ncbi:Uu.00g089960.m01.CDS01 [Anthostomella pinea]|uniref:Uu.00g089960.m01.CDS01 n=1 Tax=Anthostomella pinea TaxID=933095 RepID=A0AAI8VNZ6_9PEZI|nr:Uu.00g089960.m01.CDS01 [Anthostomella pinea]
MRLSWPRANDRKRAILGKPTTTRVDGGLTFPVRIVNTSSWDIECHHYLISSDSLACPPRKVPQPMSWSPVKTDTDSDLLQYFKVVVSDSLTTVRPEMATLRDVLMPMALSNAPLSEAVLQSLLALSSLHRHGLQSHAARAKLSALSALATSARSGVGAHEVSPHVAALMLLCCFEIQEASDTSSQWLHYVSSVKSLLGAVQPNLLGQDSQMAVLLCWVSYHDVMSRFSLHHWRTRSSAKEMLLGGLGIPAPQPDTSRALMTSSTRFPCVAMLKMAAEIFNVVLEPDEARSRGIDIQNLLTVLEQKLTSFPLPAEPAVDSAHGGRAMLSEDLATMAIFQLTLLVYLERAAGGPPAQSGKMKSRLKRAFAMFARLETFQRQFPLLILGCEARTDADRIVVLDLIARTERDTGVRSLQGTKALLQSFWAQDDLAETGVAYIDKFNAVFSSSDILPAFV